MTVNNARSQGDQEYMYVAEFAKRIGVSVSTVKRWEKNGDIAPHHRTIGNYRMYSSQQVEDYFRAHGAN